uniref:Polyprotein protein n=1 Tax=Solanum tuberosum TaxID=4113 RepID=M1DPY7_SOLTU
MVFGIVEIPNVPEIPPTTTGQEDRMKKTTDPVSEAETDAEMLKETEGATDDDLTETEAAMIDAAVQASLANTPFAVPSGAGPFEVTLGIETRDQIDSPGNDAQIDGDTS